MTQAQMTEALVNYSQMTQAQIDVAHKPSNGV
jgi:hypothetical protein